jgi:hypothetical protein
MDLDAIEKEQYPEAHFCCIEWQDKSGKTRYAEEV